MAKKKRKRPGGGRPPGARGQPARGQPARGQPARGQPARGAARPATSTKSPPARSKPTKAQRVEAARRARRRKAMMSRVAIGAIAALVVAFVVVRVVGGRGEEAETVRRLTAGSCVFDRKADPTDPGSASHVADPTYEVQPPAGGNHDPQAARRAVYTEERVPPDGQVVHAMEHGYVVLWHKPDLSERDRQTVLEVAGRYEVDVLVVPRPSLSTPVAATAWGRRLLCGGVEPDALDLFTRTYRNQGPEQVRHD